MTAPEDNADNQHHRRFDQRDHPGQPVLERILVQLGNFAEQPVEIPRRLASDEQRLRQVGVERLFGECVADAAARGHGGGHPFQPLRLEPVGKACGGKVEGFAHRHPGAQQERHHEADLDQPEVARDPTGDRQPQFECIQAQPSRGSRRPGTGEEGKTENCGEADRDRDGGCADGGPSGSASSRAGRRPNSS